MRVSTSLLGRALHALGSVQLAMMLLIGGVAAMAVGTLVESRAGLELARSVIYRTLWFDLYLALLGVNLVAAVFNRLPIKRHQWGFVLTHFAIVVLLSGVWISRSFGFEGRVVVAEHGESQTLQMNGTLIGLRKEGEGAWEYFEWPAGAFLEGELLQVGEGGRPHLEIVQHVPFGVPISELRAESGGAFGVELRLDSPVESTREWLLLGSRNLCNKDSGLVVLELLQYETDEDLQVRLAPQVSVPGAYSDEAGDARKPVVSVISGPGNELYMQVTTQAGRAMGRSLTLNEGLDVQALGLRLTVTRQYEAAKPWTRVEEVSAASEGATPCLLMSVAWSEGRSEFWLSRGASRRFSKGGDAFIVDYQCSRQDLPFSIHLDEFRMRTHSGSHQPMSLVSHITLRQLGRKHTAVSTVVAVGQPVDFLGFRIFQSSYEKGQGESPGVSVLSVTHDPGAPVVYTAFILLILGISWHLLGDQRRRVGRVLVPEAPPEKTAIRTGQEVGMTGELRPHQPSETPSMSEDSARR